MVLKKKKNLESLQFRWIHVNLFEENKIVVRKLCRNAELFLPNSFFVYELIYIHIAKNVKVLKKLMTRIASFLKRHRDAVAGFFEHLTR